MESQAEHSIPSSEACKGKNKEQHKGDILKSSARYIPLSQAGEVKAGSWSSWWSVLSMAELPMAELAFLLPQALLPHGINNSDLLILKRCAFQLFPRTQCFHFGTALLVLLPITELGAAHSQTRGLGGYLERTLFEPEVGVGRV